MNCISSRSIQACAQLRNVCSRSHILPARLFTRFSLARVCDLRASSRRAPSCASCHTPAPRNIFTHSSAPQLSQRSSRKRNMGSNAIVAPEEATTADNNPLLEVSCLPRCTSLVISSMLSKHQCHEKPNTDPPCMYGAGLSHSTVR